ncbi:hypothetical protein [Peribacillus sp. ACCC06369]|uniref:hypothetical protein n=1 Tax=Peribacillus sp. ACCC06369 TaxID=3055860 RepID=UPI0025A2813E|nr:hypothetical protein [Peribacillus sp. ACCC06369]MDM5358214.1 hypothetical protein [Peribacillus sp. ACCC06369]
MEENDKFREFISDDFRLWIDGVKFNQRGSLIFNSNRLHRMVTLNQESFLTGTTRTGKAFVVETPIFIPSKGKMNTLS